MQSSSAFMFPEMTAAKIFTPGWHARIVKTNNTGFRFHPMVTGNAGNEVHLVSGIIRRPEGWDFSVCIGDRCLIIFLAYNIKNYYLSFVIYFIFDILRRITTFSVCHSAFFVVEHK